MHIISETALFAACRTLFGKEVNLSHDFLSYLQPSGAKSAFRSQAKAHHPDYYADSAPQVREQQTKRFREIRQAYDLLTDFLANRHHGKKISSGQRRSSHPATYSPSRAAGKRTKPAPRSQATVAVPAISLEFGMYSYYKGQVTYQDLIEALVWQRRQRPMIGMIAQKWGWLTEDKIRMILQHRGHSSRFGKKAIELGYLKHHQVEALLHHQRSMQQRIGRHFVEKGLLTEEEADSLSEDLKSHNHYVDTKNYRRASGRR